MHELSIAHQLVEMATEAAEASDIKRVEAVHVKLGVLSSVVKEALHFAFDVVSEGTPLEGARLVIEDVPVKVYCPSCAVESTLAKPFPLRCPQCGQRTGDVRDGRQIELFA